MHEFSAWLHAAVFLSPQITLPRRRCALHGDGLLGHPRLPALLPEEEDEEGAAGEDGEVGWRPEDDTPAEAEAAPAELDGLTQAPSAASAAKRPVDLDPSQAEQAGAAAVKAPPAAGGLN